jgi:acetyltransferase-like isoleucine patch superfamily enzyme
MSIVQNNMFRRYAIVRTLGRSVIHALRKLRLNFLSFGMPKPHLGRGRFIRRDRCIDVSIKIAKGASIELLGNVNFQSDLGQCGHTRIALGKRARLRVLGDFIIGPDVLIIVSDDAELVLGGRNASTGSGITGSTRIMVRERVEIGSDSIIAWDVFITDCDWHTIEGKPHTKPTVIGKHVWLTHGTSVLKGSNIGDGSIVAAHGICMMCEHPPHSLLGGTPARVLKQDVAWHRDLV